MAESLKIAGSLAKRPQAGPGKGGSAMNKIVCAAVAMLAGCGADEGAAPPSVGMANPASVYCIEAGGRLEIRQSGSGQVGVCRLADGVEIEEWALYRRDHPAAR